MAVTALTVVSNRLQADTVLSASVTSIDFGAQTSEFFTLPTGFGHLLIKRARIYVDLASNFVASTHLWEGAQMRITGEDGNTVIDIVPSRRWLAGGDTALQPVLISDSDITLAPILLRRQERFQSVTSILTGASATGTIICWLAGERIYSA